MSDIVWTLVGFAWMNLLADVGLTYERGEEINLCPFGLQSSCQALEDVVTVRPCDRLVMQPTRMCLRFELELDRGGNAGFSLYHCWRLKGEGRTSHLARKMKLM